VLPVNPSPSSLSELLAHVRGAHLPPGSERIVVTGVEMDSRQVRPGTLYVAVPGTRVDGHDFVEDAVGRGAAAVLVHREVPAVDVPVIRVADSRRALAEVAAAWHGHPAERLRLVGVTGSFGKTTVVMMLDAILVAAGQPVGGIGSEMVGIRFRGTVLEHSPYTTPDALLLHRALADLRERGADRVAMEVTSHALAQKRVHRLEYDVGVFTNLAPLEHKEYHPTFEHYIQSKLRFFDHVRRGAPLVFFGGDPALRHLMDDLPLHPVACDTEAGADVRFAAESMTVAGMRVRLEVPRALPRPDGGEVPPTDFDFDLPLLGTPYLRNAALAATTALLMGAGADDVRRALAAFSPPRRRLQVIRCGAFDVLDDTAQHPDSLSAVFGVVERLPHRRLHIAYAVRGQRGPEINHQLATTLGIWAGRVPIDTLVVTSSEEAVDAANRVDDAEREAFLGGLSEQGVGCRTESRLEDAVRGVLDHAGEGDLVLFLGPFGMHGAAEILDAWCEERGIRRGAA
jgi:UDP-N-acetylmuramoyl-L-alanyl-D-glutamate--2,6-diaminopimelate ligase